MAEKELDFETIRDGLKGLPCTWYPALFKALVDAAVDANTFKPGMIADFVARAEQEKRSQ